MRGIGEGRGRVLDRGPRSRRAFSHAAAMIDGALLGLVTRSSRPRRSVAFAHGRFLLIELAERPGPAGIMAGRSTRLSIVTRRPSSDERLERLHHLQHVQRQRAAGAVRPARADGGAMSATPMMRKLPSA